MNTSIRLSTSTNIKLATGAIPFCSSSPNRCLSSASNRDLSSSRCKRLLSCSACDFRPANLSNKCLSSPNIFCLGRTSGKMLGRNHRLNTFSLMWSPWYPRTSVVDIHRCWKSVSVVDLKVTRRDSPSANLFLPLGTGKSSCERRQRLNKFRRSQL